MSDAAATSENLPDDIVALKALVGEKSALAHVLSLKIAALEEELRLLLHKRFGASSEKANPDQLQLFNEAEATAEQTDRAETPETASELADAINPAPGY